MNEVLQLKGRFNQAKNNATGGGPKLPTGGKVKTNNLNSLKNDLDGLLKSWREEDLISGALISARYNKIAAKSNRIQVLLAKGSQKTNDFIVGAKYSNDVSPKHIITYHVSLEAIENSIEMLAEAIEILKREFNNEIASEDFKEVNNLNFEGYELSKSKFKALIVDCFYLSKFKVPSSDVEELNDSIITIFDTDTDTVELMKKIGINLSFNRVIDNTTLLLTPFELKILKDKASYLISMGVSDFSQITKDEFSFVKKEKQVIPDPQNEPTIGVIDTLFNENVYFSKWVEYENQISDDIITSNEDFEHGTAVSSIIVDGPTLNPNLDDGCGRFKVKHFGVTLGTSFSSFNILKTIEKIIIKNRNIKVWNLSLGSEKEINKNFISPEGSILDKLQYEYDVTFVVAGTNKPKRDDNINKIGAPADSINSIVVNSIDSNNKPASYSRKGPVLSFFTKPDICYYGGDEGSPLNVCSIGGISTCFGTSFAAPWIARKLSYLIDILGLSREVAKALIIDSATGWNKQEFSSSLTGYGVVPVRIEDIVTTPEDEIQFILSGVSEKYDTYNYDLPVPITKDGSGEKKHPFIARATLCYFPCCSREQGVDYTNTELSISLGRIHEKKKTKDSKNGKEEGKVRSIKPINNNYQDSEENIKIFEKDARRLYRKWDNVKHIREVSRDKIKARKAYESEMWGISLKTKERLGDSFGKNLKFGVVVTLKEINGRNRIDEFIKACSLRGWLVNKLDVENQVDIYNKAEEEIIFE